MSSKNPPSSPMNPMNLGNCAEFRSLAVHALLGKASAEEVAACRRHVERCSRCALESKGNVYVVDLLRAARVPPTSSSFKDKLARRFEVEIAQGDVVDSERYLRFSWRERIEAELVWIGYRFQNSTTLKVAAAAAILLAIAMFGVLSSRRGTSAPTTPGTLPLPPEGVKDEPKSRRDDPTVPVEVANSPSHHVVESPDGSNLLVGPRAKAPEVPDVISPQGPGGSQGRGAEGGLAVNRDRDPGAGESESLRDAVAAENRFQLSRFLMKDRFAAPDGRDKEILSTLRWLKEAQEDDGSFDPSRNGGDAAVRVGTTGLVTLSLLSNPRSIPGSEYRFVVGRAVEYLRKSVARDSTLGRVSGRGERDFEYTLFNHALATAALAEHALVENDHADDVLLREALLRLSDLSKKREPGTVQAADATTAPWVAFAFETARAAGVRPVFDLAEEAQRARGFLVALADPSQTRRGITAVAMVGPQAAATALESQFGKARGSVEPATPSVLIDHLKRPEYREPTKIFFAASDLRARGGEAWTRWQKATSEVLVPSRHNDGHYSTDGYRFDWIQEGGGDVYTTALAVLTLSVEWRNH